MKDLNMSIRCNHCQSTNVVHERTNGHRDVKNNKSEVYIDKTYFCNKCKRFFFKKKQLIVDKDFYKICKHNDNEKSYMPFYYPETKLPFTGIDVRFCLNCGAYLLTCGVLKNALDKSWPNFWQYSWGKPFLYHPLPCKYCSGDNFEDISQELSHAFAKALVLTKKENPNLYQALFSGSNSSISELERKLERETNIYFRVKYNKFAYKFLPGLIEYLMNRRRKLYKEIGDKRKEFEQYIRKGRNYYREKFDLPKLGEGWISETTLLKLVKKHFKDLPVYHNNHPSWLKGLELDIYIPDIKLAIEYMGKQHYEPVTIFGGEEGYIATVERDKRKKELCEKKGIKLIYFDYQTDVSKQNLKLILGEKATR